MKKIVSLFMLLCFITVINAQKDGKPVIKFENSSYDFGTFDESEGKVTTEFKFTNDGTSPLVITRTAASCGCTTPEYPKEPISPGKTGIIKVTYNAKGRPGHFQKSVYVYANTDPEKTTLIIKGNVNPKEVSEEEAYNREIGELKLKSKHISFMDVFNTKSKSEVIGVFNPTNKPISVTFVDLPRFLNVKMEPNPLPANTSGEIVTTIYPDRCKEWGVIKGDFSVLVNKQKANANLISFTADIKEDFSAMTDKDKENAPAIALNSSVISMGEVEKKFNKDITIKNTGKTDLVIRGIKTSNPIYGIVANQTKIKPGDSANIVLSCDPSESKSKVLNSNITIITNDPVNSIKVLKVRAFSK